MNGLLPLQAVRPQPGTNLFDDSAHELRVLARGRKRVHDLQLNRTRTASTTVGLLPPGLAPFIPQRKRGNYGYCRQIAYKQHQKKNPTIFSIAGFLCNSLVGRTRFELVTNGLKVPKS